jgi:hypothetical protein
MGTLFDAFETLGQTRGMGHRHRSAFSAIRECPDGESRTSRTFPDHTGFSLIPDCCNNPKCPSISARDPEIGVPKPDTE